MRRSSQAVAALVLAAGQSRRMGDRAGHKLLARFDGEPLLRRSVRIAVGSQVERVLVVMGDEPRALRAALAGLDVEVLINPHADRGMAASLALGLDAVGSGDNPVAGVMVLLADMPGLTTAHLDALISAFRAANGGAVIRGTDGERPGNPVILPQDLFAAVAGLTGDRGARDLIAASGLPILSVDIGPAALLDVDTPDQVLAAGGVLALPTTSDGRGKA